MPPILMRWRWQDTFYPASMHTHGEGGRASDKLQSPPPLLYPHPSDAISLSLFLPSAPESASTTAGARGREGQDIQQVDGSGKPAAAVLTCVCRRMHRDFARAGVTHTPSPSLSGFCDAMRVWTMEFFYRVFKEASC